MRAKEKVLNSFAIVFRACLAPPAACSRWRLKSTACDADWVKL